MTEEYDTKLLLALDRLVARYGSARVTRLADLIRDPEHAEEIAGMLESAAAHAPRGKSTRGGKKSDRVGMGVLRELRRSDPDKHAIIAEVRQELIAGSVLSSMEDLRRFAAVNDLPIGKASSRTAAIAPLLKSMSRLPIPEIAELRDSMMLRTSDDRSLERWRDLIVRTRPADLNEEDR